MTSACAPVEAKVIGRLRKFDLAPPLARHCAC